MITLARRLVLRGLASGSATCAISDRGGKQEQVTMVNLNLIDELLTVQGASQLTGGMVSERRIWQLVKDGTLSYVSDGDNRGIPVVEVMRLLGVDEKRAA